MVYHGIPWCTLVNHDTMVYHKPWYTMVIHGIPCTMVYDGVQRYTIIHRGIPRYDRVVTHCGRTMVPVCSGLPRFTTVLQRSISW